MLRHKIITTILRTIALGSLFPTPSPCREQTDQRRRVAESAYIPSKPTTTPIDKVCKQKSKGNNRVGRCAAFALLFLVFNLQPWFIGIAAGLSGVYALSATRRRWSICSLHGLGFGKNESCAMVLRIVVIIL